MRGGRRCGTHPHKMQLMGKGKTDQPRHKPGIGEFKQRTCDVAGFYESYWANSCLPEPSELMKGPRQKNKKKYLHNHTVR